MRKLLSARAWGLLPAALFLTGCGADRLVIVRPDDANHAKIGVTTGTTGEAIAKKRFPEAQIKSFDDAMSSVAAVKSGQLDVIITSSPGALQIVKKNADLTIVSEPLSDEDSSIALRKGDPRLAAVNRILTELKNDGAFESMKKRWFKNDLSPYDEPDIKLPTQGPPLRVGVAANREPFNFVDQNGRVTGHDGELARLVAQKLGQPIEFTDMKFMALIPALQSGKIDMIITGMTATPERAKAVDFSQPYYVNHQVMLVRKPPENSGGPKLTSLEDLKDKRIGVLLGSAQDVYATKTYPAAKIFDFDSSSDLVQGLKSGKVDAAFYDEEPLRDVLQESDGLAVFGDNLFSSEVGAGFNKNAPDLRDNFNRFLAQIKANGTYAEMVARWITRRETRMPRIDTPKNAGVLAVGVSAGGAPFTMVHDNELMGFDVELAKRFAASLGKDVKFSDMQFSGLIGAVASGKVDMIVASIYITGERKQQIDFSDPYYAMGNRAFALKSSLASAGGSAASGGPSFWQSVESSFQSNIIHEKRYLLIWDGLKTTVLLSVLATVFGTLLGALVCMMRMSRHNFLNVPAKIYISILRGTPVLVLLMLIFYVVFASIDISPVLVATVAFGMNFAAYVSEMFRTGIEGIDTGQTEAGIAMGFSRLKTFLYIVLPQALRRILPVYKGEFISLVKMTSIVGYIAVQDLTKASDIIRSRTFDAFFPLVMVAILYFFISWTLMQSLQYVERVIDPKYRRRKAQAAA
jgi:His/Glu/Gln/Arg/opine family amino acid ABC transporter permease subunit